MNIPTPIENCYWVLPGKLLAGEYPGLFNGQSSEVTNAELLVPAGVTDFFDLTTESDGLASYEPLIDRSRFPDVKINKFPIPDCSVPVSRDQTVKILDSIDAAIENEGLAYVHCWGGIGRTGTIIGCWLSRRGKKGSPALNRLRELWCCCPKSKYCQSPETDKQTQYILNWNE